MLTAERALNYAAFLRMEAMIKENYSHGEFVGIAGGEIVGHAPEFMTLYE